MRNYTSIKERKAERVFELREKGYSYKDIKDETGISLGTISYHLGHGQKEKTKFRNQKNVPSRKERKREFVYLQKLNKPCSSCGVVVDPVALDFHHKERETKSWPISVMTSGNWSIQAIQEEINKCILLCANCHRVTESEINNDFYAKRRRNDA